MKQENTTIETVSRRAVVVLGMHRSGTSALSGLLMKLGCDGPATLLGSNANNPLGYFESKLLYHVQDELLNSAGTSWDDYGPLPEDWFNSFKKDEYQNRLQSLLNSEFGDSSLFVVKDPRTCRLMPLWLDVFSEMKIDPVFVHTHRHPTEVAKSLLKRNGFDREYGYLLWLRHVLDAEIGSRGQMRSFTSYDRILTNWAAEIEKIAIDLDISWPKYSGSHLPELDAMIQPDLKHNASDGIMRSKVFSAWFRDTFDVFERWAEHGEDIDDHLTLDRIRQKFNESTVAFASTVHAQGALRAEEHAAFEKLTSERDSARTEAQEHRKVIEMLTVERDDLAAQAKARDAALEKLTSENASLTEQLHLGHSMLGQRKAELDDTLKEFQAAKELLDQEKRCTADLVEELSLTNAQLRVIEATQTKRAHDVGRAQQTILRYQDKLAKNRIELAKRTDAHTQKLKNLTAHATYLEEMVQAYKSSTSWRITGPIRWLVLHFRKWF